MRRTRLRDSESRPQTRGSQLGFERELVDRGANCVRFRESYLDPNDAIPPSSASATCEAEYEYLYCVPGTYTYIFFGIMKASLANATEYATAINSGVEYIDEHIQSSNDSVIENGDLYLTNDATNVLIYVEDATKHNLTWGVAGAALQGLGAWMAGRNNGYSDATFQINDGRNWVGSGFVGAFNAEGQCVFANAFVPNTTCTATDTSGYVYGYNGGRLC